MVIDALSNRESRSFLNFLRDILGRIPDAIATGNVPIETGSEEMRPPEPHFAAILSQMLKFAARRQEAARATTALFDTASD
ncbi:hypothetical protein PZN02_003139 [Sinorhizobium garamanticum]|uniref:Uncharacterized protein n=1 Tax=Sinorhizobium garamanticum TaxID=680247 RepID=A0ABY8D7F5_9HYPH|nr:hypothetical protein [Sinorhizobium garamanticum]WEX86808.1 hypothetical protein PZN02_003139 [Sinorhizobium garamanticum]